MANGDQLVLRPQGAYLLGQYLTRLEWALAAVTTPLALTTQLQTLLQFANIHPFDDIGREATGWYNFFSDPARANLSTVPPQYLSELRDAKTRWQTLAQERLEGLYLVTPATVLDPKRLMAGVAAFLEEGEIDLLEEIEVYDLGEACACLLVGAPTASERMALRAAENLLRRWYELRTGKRIRRQSWGRILYRLVEEYPEQNRPKELALLGYLRDRRNELDHPEKTSTPTSGVTTLMNVITLIKDIEPMFDWMAHSDEPGQDTPAL